ncbi:ferric-dicitrate binding protein FerR, regulates iron transport through sigma-19 [Parapedobacter composti]|uniref:Ferric-dicitrate binding protein FerR, regulates iron transport through sigma-19 n=1 Tax=Parapedobacter composti TaxID=623281 RepID=A0A1I1KYX7_9SPHI|nr:FecR domain-containing protein [Parapedobacter composti]SFC62610.1 ferric-dicitrate binding protein FerR, regulates iron transport through sigma-19 [Parapedobacter composti]
MDSNIDRETIQRYLEGTCTPEEAARVAELLKQDGAENILRQLLDADWQRFDEGPADGATAKAWQQKFVARVRRRGRHSRFPFQRFSQAAIWLLLAGASFFIYQTLTNRDTPTNEERIAHVEMQEVATQRGQRKTVHLPDSSVIYLGPESRLRFARNFNGLEKRAVQFTGEAFFEVHPNPDKPFTVHSGDLETRVLGTSFKIDAHEHQPYTVQVATGKVRVSKTTPDSIEALADLTKGQAIQYTSHTATVSRLTADPTHLTAWKNGMAVYENISLAALAREIARWYDVDVTIHNPDISAYRITIALSWKDPLERSLKAIKATANFDYTITDRKIVLHH